MENNEVRAGGPSPEQEDPIIDTNNNVPETHEIPENIYNILGDQENLSDTDIDLAQRIISGEIAIYIPQDLSTELTKYIKAKWNEGLRWEPSAEERQTFQNDPLTHFRNREKRIQRYNSLVYDASGLERKGTNPQSLLEYLTNRIRHKDRQISGDPTVIQREPDQRQIERWEEERANLNRWKAELLELAKKKLSERNIQL